MKWTRSLLVFAVLYLAACGGNVVDKKGKEAECGNGLLGPSETCDPGIAAGEPGACPTSCDGEGDAACGAMTLVGDPFSCTAECVMTEAACGADDGCCPDGCDSGDDDDCVNTCGNGTVEGAEICDGNCPSTCDDRDTCTVDSFSGSVDTCNLRCENAPLSECIDADGCCPAGCTSAEDDDCLDSCGDGTLDPGELCDGDCPATCPDDGDACTAQRLVGSPSTCNAQCVSDPVTQCQSDDGCCPQGCTDANDTDCSCTPRTCADVGSVCGMLDDLCGSTRSCGTCSAGQRCSAGACVPDGNPTGELSDPCDGPQDCMSGECSAEEIYGQPGGYCTSFCEVDADCGTDICGASKTCWKTCTSANDCRSGLSCEPLFGGSEPVCRGVGMGNRAVGDTCNVVSDCGGGANANCATEAFGWKDGYCRRFCDDQTPCPSGSHCDAGSTCIKNCTSDASCRGGGFDGYKCYDIDGDGTKECRRAGTGARGVGQPCDGPWECAGGTAGFCANEPNGFPDGYCAVDCGSNSSCPAGSVCSFFLASNVCLDECTTDADCRTGYSCTSDFVQNVCWPT